ncbi:TPA: hypothetical protein DCE37_16510 [Candidatus Latescibacteria bacterium]|nr:hypothetical protein [Candidatus Latescibacterota bacterium]
MLTPNQLAHFRTFGFLRLTGLFAQDIANITRESQHIWESDETPRKNQEIRLDRFIERSPPLHRLVIDDRVYPVVEQLLGPDFIWVGSEGNVSGRNRVNWHADRKYYRGGEGHWIDYTQVKLMLYLDPLSRETGCLRVIPGSHRMPLHSDLANQEIDAASEPFGLDGPDLPSAALETTPGDLIIFNHCLWHAAYGGGPDRRYVALKFAARPTQEDQLVSLERYTPHIFNPHEAFLKHSDARIRKMVAALPSYRSGRLCA